MAVTAGAKSQLLSQGCPSKEATTTLCVAHPSPA